MKVTTINIAAAKAHFTEYARRVQAGERFVLCNRNKPFAEIRPLHVTPQGKRPFGLGRGLLSVPDDFNKPDPEIEELFNGRMP